MASSMQEGDEVVDFKDDEEDTEAVEEEAAAMTERRWARRSTISLMPSSRAPMAVKRRS